jgi:hypothetical protein
MRFAPWPPWRGRNAQHRGVPQAAHCFAATLAACAIRVRQGSTLASDGQKYHLFAYPYKYAAARPFGEAIFNLEYDVMSATTKSRQFGFHEAIDTEEMLLRPLAQFQKMGFIPT